MKEPSVHRRTVESSQRSSEGIRQNGFTSVFLRDCTKARCNLVQCLVPGNALPDSRINMLGSRYSWSWKATFFVMSAGSAVDWPFAGNAPHWIQDAVRRVHPIQVFCHLRAQEPSRHRMFWVALDLRCSPILHRNQDSTGVRTVVRTGGMNDVLHTTDYKAKV